MIFADKLIKLRKQNGWSQEELAEQMDVTRQSISKWEGAQSIPDYEKLIRLSELFGVSTDYLLKDEIEEAEPSGCTKEVTSTRHVSLQEANDFLAIKAAASKLVAYGVLLCILSPICLLILGAMSEIPEYGLPDNVAAGVGMVVLLALIAAAVAVFISCGNKTSAFEYLEKEVFETEYGVNGMVKERREQYKNTYAKSNLIGTCLCIVAVIPLFLGVAINGENILLLTVMLSTLLVLVGIGVVFFVRGGIIWASFETLLQEGDYTKAKKEKQPLIAAVSTAYWLAATAIYLAYSFVSGNWGYSWIVWPVAGVVFPAVIAILNAFDLKKDRT